MNTKQSIYIFNPTSDYAIANGDENWHSNRLLQKMEEDLALLPLYFANKNDFVIANPPSTDFLNLITSLGLETPEFVSKHRILSHQKLLTTKNTELFPWGWSPAMHKLLRPLKHNCSDSFRSSPVFNWEKEYRHLYSKEFAHKILKKLHSNFRHKDFIETAFLPEVCVTQQEIEVLLKKWGSLMIKTPWGSSGRGLQPITKTPVHEKVWEKIMGMVNDQGAVIVEPYLNKVFDLALQFRLKRGRVHYLGPSHFLTDRKGQYLGNYLNGLPDSFEKELKEFINTITDFLIEPLKNVIEQSLLSSHYEGYFGIDTLIFLNQDKQLKINPCLEINLRMNMGLLALQIQKLLGYNKQGMFKIYYNPKKSYYNFKSEMAKRFPLLLQGKKVHSGFLSLTEANKNSDFGAYIIV